MQTWHSLYRRLAASATIALTCALSLPPTVAHADSYIASTTDVDGQRKVLKVYSASMGREIQVDVQLPADNSVPRPALYLLNGIGGGVDGATWKAKSNVLPWLATQNINVVQPVGGQYSYYTDWNQPDKAVGVAKWKTFLTQELPPLVDAALGTSGANAIAGISSSGTSVLQLAEAAPGLYRSVASYSGCAQISDPVGEQFVRITLAKGGAEGDNMYGPSGSPAWRDNDPYLGADRLRGLAIYVSNGNGLPGAHDVPFGPDTLPGVGGWANQVVVGGAIEAATNTCTHNLQGRLASLGIPAQFNFLPAGTHSWGYWSDVFKDSWPVLTGPLGI